MKIFNNWWLGFIGTGFDKCIIETKKIQNNYYR